MALETEDLRLDDATLREGVAAILSDPAKGMYYLVEEGGVTCAQMMITLEWSDWRNAQMWWIQSVYTHPGHRRRGHFKALYRHVEQAGKAEGAGGLRLYVDNANLRAQETYRAMGMKTHYALYEDLFTDY